MTRARLLGALLLALGAARCATLATSAGDDDAPRPTASAGPFREARPEELGSTSALPAPYLLRKENRRFREASALPLDDRPLGETALYVVAEDVAGNPGGIYRFVAPDARRFSAAPESPVLTAEAAWEGASIGEPEAHRVGDEIFVYYSGRDGIGLARSRDGVSFTREPAPVLGAEGGGAWEAGAAPASPALLEVGPGDYRLFYAAGGRIGEARSSDGVRFERVSDAPALEPAGGGGGDDPPFDSEAVAEPSAVLMRSAEGRLITRLYYAGRGPGGKRAIGMAARFGTDGAFTRALAPVFAATRDARSPSVVIRPGVSLLYLTENSGATGSALYPAVALGVAPGNLALAAP